MPVTKMKQIMSLRTKIWLVFIFGFTPLNIIAAHWYYQSNLQTPTTALLGIILSIFIPVYLITYIVTYKYIAFISNQDKKEKGYADFSGLNRDRILFTDEIDVLINSMKSMLQNLNKQKAELLQNRTEMQELVQNTLRVQEAERRFVAHELHDEAGQLLVSLRYTIEMILMDLPPVQVKQATSRRKAKTIQEQLSKALEQIDETIETIRALSHKMRPALLDVGDINLAMQQYCNEFKQNKKWNITYEGTTLSDPAEEIALALFRFLQEALTNIVKHTTPTEVNVRLVEENDWITLSVFDNGGGMGPNPGIDGIGILGMRERFNLLKGIVDVNSLPDGFQIKVRVPLK